MKKHIRIILTICLALCMVICLGLTVACQNNDDTFTITVLNEDETPASGFSIQYCRDGENAQCEGDVTDSKGQVKVNISTAEWKNSKKMHIQLTGLAEGYYAVCDADDSSYGWNEGPYIDHHTVKSVTFTIIEEAEAELVEMGVENDVRDFSVNVPKKYSTFIRTAHGARIEADVHGGEFELSVSINGETATAYTLDADNTSVDLTFANSTFPNAGNTIVFKLTSKNASSARATFTVCPVLELNSIIIVNRAETYKVYYILTADSTNLAFSNPYGDLSTAVAGFPVTLTIGNETPVTWNSGSDINNIHTTQKGTIPFVFTFNKEDIENAKLTLVVSNADASSDRTITLDKPVSITLSDDAEGKEFSFTPSEAGTYVITVNAAKAIVQYTRVDSSIQSAQYKASEHEGHLEIEIVLSAGENITILFATENAAGETYTATVTKKAN